MVTDMIKELTDICQNSNINFNIDINVEKRCITLKGERFSTRLQKNIQYNLYMGLDELYSGSDIMRYKINEMIKKLKSYL